MKKKNLKNTRDKKPIYTQRSAKTVYIRINKCRGPFFI